MPELPTTRRGAETSRRILDAAAEEFARHGIAGARIDRITATAKTNKAQVYGYFGSKEGLFDAVMADKIDSTGVPFDANDLPGWAVAVYDQHLSRPDLARLMGWIRLEQRPTGRLFENFDFGPKLAAVTRAQASGRLRAGDPFDLVALILSMASTWSAASGFHASSPDEPAADHERRRELLRECVERIVKP
jgi:AcrR family transcriptional regulator